MEGVLDCVGILGDCWSVWCVVVVDGGVVD